MFLIPIILTVAIAITGFFGFQKQQDYMLNLEQQIQEADQNLGSYYSVGGKYYKLWGSGIDSDDTSLILTSFKSPINDLDLAMSNFGEIGYGTIEPENTSNVEFISFEGITQDSASDKATLTGVTRGLNFVYPYNSSTTLAKSHAGGSRFIISNPPVHYGEYAAKRNAETIQGDWTFSATSTPQYNANPSFTSASKEFASIKFVEDTANQGAATSSEVQGGIVEIASSAELGLGNATGSTGYIIVLQNRFATTTPFATSSIPVTGTDGKLDQSFVDLTEPWNWTASTTMSATTTIGDSSDDYAWINASTTFKSPTYFNSTTTFRNTTTTFDRLPRVDSESANATSTSFYSIATVGYVNNNDTDSLNSGYQSREWWTEYQATTSGFIIATRKAYNLSVNSELRMAIFAGATASASTTGLVVAYAAHRENETDSLNVLTLTVPVPKNFYWQASSTFLGGGDTAIYNSLNTLYWVAMK